MPSENERYLENGEPNLQYSNLAQGSEVNRLHDGNIFEKYNILKGLLQAVKVYT